MEKLFAGIFFIIVGAMAIAFNKFFGKIAWMGMSSAYELIKGEDKERRYYNRARFIRFLGAGFAVAGGVLIIGFLFQNLPDQIRAEDIEKELKLTDDISDWKTYRNEKYGFEVQYPSGTPIIDFSKTSLDIEFGDHPPGSLLQIGARENNARHTLDALEDNLKKSFLSGDGDKLWKVEKTTFAGASAIKVSLKKEATPYDYFLIKDGFEYIFSVPQQKNDIHEKMMRTFKFMK